MPNIIPPDIPGFYFDRERNRYFRLLANHAGPTASFYTPDSIRKREQQTSPRPVPSPPTKRKSNGPPSWLAHELGNSTIHSRRLSKAELYASGLTGHQLLQGSFDDATAVFAFNSGDEVVFVVGYLNGRIKTHVARAGADGIFRCDEMFIREYPGLDGQVTSIILLSTGTLLISSLGGPRNLHLFRVSPNGILLTVTNSYHSLGPTRASAHSPSNGAIVFADDFGLHFYRNSKIRSPSHIFSLAFSTHNLLLAGARDGCVRSFDRRPPPGGLQPVVRHGDSVRHVKALGDPSSPSSYFVVSGLRKCALYDLRYCSSIPGTQITRPLAEFNIADDDHPTTTTTTTTQAHHNAGRLKYAFDVNSMGVVAVPQQHSAAVKLFDAWTGKPLGSHGQQGAVALTFHAFRIGDPQALVAAGFDGSLTSYEY